MLLFGKNVLVLGEAVVVLAAASAAIRFLSFQRVMALAGRRATGERPRDWPATTSRIRWAVGYAADRVPWRAVCFQRGLAVQWMARRRGIDTFLHYGIDGQSDGRLSAHVWVELDNQPIVGGADAPRHARVLVRPDPTAGRA